MNIKKLSGRKLIISSILIMVVLICAHLFINGNRAQKTDLDNLASKPTIEQTPKVIEQTPQVIEQTPRQEYPRTNIIETSNTNNIDNILSMKEIFSSKSSSMDLFVVGEYKNTLAIYGSDGRLGGIHEKESFSLIDKDTYTEFLYIESNIDAPYIWYHIDSEKGYCYILHDKFFRKYDMSTGKVIWEYEDNYLISFVFVDDSIYLTKFFDTVILDPSTGKEANRKDLSGYDSLIYSPTKPQKLFIMKNSLNTNVKLLDKSGKIVKDLNGRLDYYNNEIIILEVNSQGNKSRVFKYLGLDNPNEEIDIILNSEENIQVLSSKYLLITQKNGIKLFSVDDQKDIWEKAIKDFRSAKIYKDNVYISGEQFICFSFKEGKEKWSVDNLHITPLDYIFSFGDKLFVSYDIPGDNRNEYRIYNIDTGKYLYHISDFPAVLPKVKFVAPFYQGADKAYISNSDGGICVIQE